MECTSQPRTEHYTWLMFRKSIIIVSILCSHTRIRFDEGKNIDSDSRPQKGDGFGGRTCMRVTTTTVVNQVTRNYSLRCHRKVPKMAARTQHRQLNVPISLYSPRNHSTKSEYWGVRYAYRTRFSVHSPRVCVSKGRYLKQVLFGSGFRCVHYDISWCINAQPAPRTCQRRAHSNTRWRGLCEENRESVIVGSLHKY